MTIRFPRIQPQEIFEKGKIIISENDYLTGLWCRKLHVRTRKRPVKWRHPAMKSSRTCSPLPFPVLSLEKQEHKSDSFEYRIFPIGIQSVTFQTISSQKGALGKYRLIKDPMVVLVLLVNPYGVHRMYVNKIVSYNAAIFFSF